MSTPITLNFALTVLAIAKLKAAGQCRNRTPLSRPLGALAPRIVAEIETVWRRSGYSQGAAGDDANMEPLYYTFGSVDCLSAKLVESRFATIRLSIPSTNPTELLL